PKTRDRVCSFNVAKYGAQQKTDPYNSACGNGARPDGSNITGNDPNDASERVTVDFMRQWVEYLVKRYDRADRGGVAIYCLDNEPTIWRSEEHTSELQSRGHLVCRLLLEKKKNNTIKDIFPSTASSCTSCRNRATPITHQGQTCCGQRQSVRHTSLPFP